jgi:RNA polymerase sigma-70 factor, ECF subfamily
MSFRLPFGCGSYRLACRLVGPDDAPDVVQEGFLSVYRNLASFRQESRFGTWLYRERQNAKRLASTA